MPDIDLVEAARAFVAASDTMVACEAKRKAGDHFFEERAALRDAKEKFVTELMWLLDEPIRDIVNDRIRDHEESEHRGHNID